MNNLRIDSARLWTSLMETARFGATPKGGLNRQALTDADRQVRDWLKAQCEAAGCVVEVDAIGNMFARRPGRDPGRPAIAMGSHLDTQPTGGKFDGVLGVLAALEVVRTLNDAGQETDAPIEIVNWTDEEGCRFPFGTLGSGVFVGELSIEDAYALADRDGKRVGDELERISYRGKAPPGGRKWDSFFELHIEQGPMLEAREMPIGIVTDVQGIRWFEIRLDGQDAHAGTTPMELRRDAAMGQAHMVLAVNAIARAHPPGVGTVGHVALHPSAINVVPGAATLTVDFRHPSDAALDAMESELGAAVARIGAELALEAHCTRTSAVPPVAFDAGAIRTLRLAADACGYRWQEMTSGASHDAAYVARVAPTAMIFVPCAGGLSHNEAESITPSDAAAGADVLLQAVLARANR